MLTYYYVCLRMVTCACMHGIAHAQFCSRPRVVVIIPGTLTADGGRYRRMFMKLLFQLKTSRRSLSITALWKSRTK